MAEKVSLQGIEYNLNSTVSFLVLSDFGGELKLY